MFDVRQFAQANNRLLGGNDPVLDPTRSDKDMEIWRDAEQNKFHRMAKVHEFLEMWQSHQNLLATQKESCSQNKQMTALGYISDTKETVKPSSSNIHLDGAAAFKLSEIHQYHQLCLQTTSLKNKLNY
jgi:hypothetical protein